MSTIIIVLATAFAVWEILKLFGVFEYSSGASKATVDVDESRKDAKKRKKEKSKLALYAQICDSFRGLVLSENSYLEHKYIIERLDIRSDVLARTLTPEELKGKFMIFLFAGILLIPFGFWHPIFWAGTVVFCLIYFMYIPKYKQRVTDEDEIIDVYFIDLYLLMYSKLRLGSKARLQTVVESYIDTLQVSSNIQMKEIMLKFARFFANNLSMYEDHEAVPHLRERYRSATIVNFCNVATQALQGIDNGDSLLTFKMELVRRKTDLMKKNAEILRRKGERSIYLIYIILFIFIAVGWYSKLPGDFF